MSQYVNQHTVTDTQLTCYIYMCNMYISDIYIGSYRLLFMQNLCNAARPWPCIDRRVCQLHLSRSDAIHIQNLPWLFNIPERTMTSNLFSECSCAHHGGTCSAFSVTTTWSCAPCSSIWPSKVTMPLFFAALREPTRLSTCCLHAQNIPPAQPTLPRTSAAKSAHVATTATNNS